MLIDDDKEELGELQIEEQKIEQKPEQSHSPPVEVWRLGMARPETEHANRGGIDREKDSDPTPIEEGDSG